jgi:hypothetical protein
VAQGTSTTPELYVVILSNHHTEELGGQGKDPAG